MSILFKTLDQIRRHEARQVSQPADAGQRKNPPAPKRIRRIGAGLVIIAGAASVLWLAQHLPWTKGPSDETAALPANHALPAGKQPGLRLAAPEVTGLEQNVSAGAISASPELVSLINKGTAHIQRNDYWKGIYYLNQAIEMEPGHIEPYINAAVALSELGLHGPAARYFSKAYGIDPDHPLLHKNLSILAEAGILEDELVVKLNAAAGRLAKPRDTSTL